MRTAEKTLRIWPLSERCLSSFGYSAGPVMLPLLYNNNYEIAQTKDTVAICCRKWCTDVRMIQIGGKHRTDGLRPWMGDSIGWYEGPHAGGRDDQLPRKRRRYTAPGKKLKVTERFYAAWDRIGFCINSKFRTRPYGIRHGAANMNLELPRVESLSTPCHEGNYALANMLGRRPC